MAKVIARPPIRTLYDEDFALGGAAGRSVRAGRFDELDSRT